MPHALQIVKADEVLDNGMAAYRVPKPAGTEGGASADATPSSASADAGSAASAPALPPILPPDIMPPSRSLLLLKPGPAVAMAGPCPCDGCTAWTGARCNDDKTICVKASQALGCGRKSFSTLVCRAHPAPLVPPAACLQSAAAGAAPLPR